MTKKQLAEELGISQPSVSRLIRHGLVVLNKDGTVNRDKTLERLWKYWGPAPEWFMKPVGPFGRTLRRMWDADKCAIDEAEWKELVKASEEALAELKAELEQQVDLDGLLSSLEPIDSEDKTVV